jgi:hypothetical protein
MTAHDKAIELLLTFSILPEGCNDTVKQCALVAVDEIIKSDEISNYPELKPHVDTMEWTSDSNWIESAKERYWQEVREEIEKI